MGRGTDEFFNAYVSVITVDSFYDATGSHDIHEAATALYRKYDMGIGDDRTRQKFIEHYEKEPFYDTGIFGTDIVTRVLFERGDGQLAANLLLDGIRDRLKEGYIVDLGPLGTLYPAVSGKWEEDPKDLALADMTPRVNYKGSDDIIAAIKGATLSLATEKDEKEGVETPDDDNTNTGNQGGGSNPPSGELEG